MKKVSKSPALKLPSEAPHARADADRRLRQAERFSRVLRLLQLLLSRGRWTRQQIAAEQECSERTVYRDLQVLELAGIPIEQDPGSGLYRVRETFRLAALPLTEDEALGQGTATSITAAPGLKLGLGAGPVTRKLKATTDAVTSQILTDAQRLISVLDLKLADHSRHQYVIRSVQGALLKNKQLTGIYRSPHDARELKVQLHPYRLCLVKQAWYLIGRPNESEQPHTYRVARFKSLRVSASKSERPDDFDLRSYFGNAWAVFRGERSYDVEILFTKEVAATVTEVVWHPTQKIRKNANGSVTLDFTIDGLNEIVRWVLGWGSRAQVVGPPELRELILVELQKAIESYRS